MYNSIILSFICEIMEQHGRVHELKKQLKRVKEELDEIGDPKPDYYCTMYPDEHGEDYEYYEKRGKKERLTESFNTLLKEKISNEKLLKKMKHQFREYQENYVSVEDHVDLDAHIKNAVYQRNERQAKELKFKSKSGEILGEMILNIMSVSYNNNVRKFLSQDIIEYANRLEALFRRAENKYILDYVPRTRRGDARRFKVAKYMANEFFTTDQETIDVIYNTMNIVTQVNKGLDSDDDETILRKSGNFKNNLVRLLEEYNDISRRRMLELPMKTI